MAQSLMPAGSRLISTLFVLAAVLPMSRGAGDTSVSPRRPADSGGWSGSSTSSASELLTYLLAHSSRRCRTLGWTAGTCLLSLVTLAVVARATQKTWLPWLGKWLVSPDAPAPADLIVVLGGDFWGRRVLEAADLAMHGYAPHVLISGPDYFVHGVPHPEGEMATRFLVEKGYPRSLFWTFPAPAHSTLDEARLLAAELRRRRVKRVLIVTSNYHSRRCSVLFHALLPFSEVRVIGVPEEYFQPESWWMTPHSRELAKSEWPKLVATLAMALGLRVQAQIAGTLLLLPAQII